MEIALATTNRFLLLFFPYKMHITFQVAVLENESYLVNHILPLEIVEWLRIWLRTVSAGL